MTQYVTWAHLITLSSPFLSPRRVGAVRGTLQGMSMDKTIKNVLTGIAATLGSAAILYIAATVTENNTGVKVLNLGMVEVQKDIQLIRLDLSDSVKRIGSLEKNDSKQDAELISLEKRVSALEARK